MPLCRLGRFLLLTTGLACLVAGPAAAQIRDELRDAVPGLEQTTKPVPVKPPGPDATVPPRQKTDPRSKAKVPSVAPLPSGPSRVGPRSVGDLDPSNPEGLRRNDLQVRLIQARIAVAEGGSNEIETTITNRGPDPFHGGVDILIQMINDEDDTQCEWPDQERVRVGRLAAGETQRVIVRTPGGATRDCIRGRGEEPDRSRIRVLAGASFNGGSHLFYHDPNRSNDSERKQLSEILRPRQLEPSPILRRVVRISNLAFERQGSSLGDTELKWIKLELADEPERKFDHPSLSIMNRTAPGAVHEHYLRVQRGDWVGVGPAAVTAQAVVREQEFVTLRIRGRDRDCASERRDCDRGDTGTIEIRFRVPLFEPGFTSTCDSPIHLRELQEFSISGGGSGPRFIPGLDGGATFPAQVCFERTHGTP